MGVKARKASKKAVKKASSQFPISDSKTSSADFLPLEGDQSRGHPETKPQQNKATVLYIGRIPHGFYEKEMEAYFKQFGAIKRLRIARNKKTGKSKHFGFIEFENPQVAEVVADCMHNYLLFEHLLQVHVIPPEHVHPKLGGCTLVQGRSQDLPLKIRWRGFNYKYKPVDYVQIERKQHNKVRTLEEHKKLVEKILKQDARRRKRIEAAGIDYECPEFSGIVHPAPKKIKFD